MTIDRRTFLGAAGAGAMMGLTQTASAQTVSAQPGGARTVSPATFQSPPEVGTMFVPGAEFATRSEDYGYVNQEWFISGTDDDGHPYLTQVYLRRPRDPARFSGVTLIEPLHFSGVASVHMVASRYILRSGHAWMCVASQRPTLDMHLRRTSAERYASLRMEPGNVPVSDPSNRLLASMAQNGACNTILAQAAAAVRARQGPFADLPTAKIILQGHSQTGMVTTFFVQQGHDRYRQAGGAPVFDGYFPAGAPIARFGPRDVPLVQLLSDGDIFDGRGIFFQQAANRAYRRPDSDARGDRYRLYEVAGLPHASTRYPPFSDPALWRAQGTRLPEGTVMNSLPHNEVFHWGLHQLVRWVKDGAVPPRAPRIQVAADGRYFAKDAHGNSLGGVRLAQMDIPRATYLPTPIPETGEPTFSSVGIERPFDAATMRGLYGTKAAYVSRFNRRLDQLIARGWFLADDAQAMRDEAAAQNF